MRNHVRGGHWITAGATAMAIASLVSCAGFDDEQAPDDPGHDSLAAAPIGKGKQPLYKDDAILVRFKFGIANARSTQVHAKHLAQVVREYRVPSNLQLVKVPQGMTVDTALQAYKDDPEVLYAEPNYIYQLATTPTDPRFNEMWGLNNTGQLGGVVDADINAVEAWDITTGSSSVIIGNLDTGFDYNHPDLAANIWTNPGEIPGNGIDDDGDGYIDDVHGIDAVNNNGNPMDTDGHGTHTTGTIAANGNNGAGVTGVNWSAQVVGCRAFNPSASLDDLLQCMDYFLMLKTRTVNPVDIVATNNSWGGGPFAQSLLDSILAFNQAGILFIAAAGNNGSNNDTSPFFPATYEADNIISVLATDRTDQRASFSNFGATTVDIGAPGVDVLSTLPNNSYGLLSGTSMATPHVTGLVGLLKAQNPNRTASQIKNLILTGGAPSPAAIGASLTGRRIRADASLTCVNRTLINRVTPTATTVLIGVGTAVPLSLLSITCDAPTTAPQIVTVIETGVTIPLIDARGTGQFDGSYTPSRIGTETLAFPNGDLVSITAVGNYDPARVVDFDFPVITGTPIALGCDDCAVSFATPFPIQFAGATPGISTIFVGSNGVLGFTTAISTFVNTALPSNIASTIVAPFWDDLILTSSGQVLQQVLGTAPTRQLVLEYRNVPRFSGGIPVTFQVVFFEGSPNIRFNYADVNADHGSSATVGVQVQTGVAQQFSFNTPSLNNGTSLLFTMGAPFAAAGPDQVVLPGASVTLNGSNSQDFDGTIASFAWIQTSGPTVVLTGANTATPTFTAPGTSATLTFQLTVTDNDGKTGVDTVNVIVDRPPVAVPNPDFRLGTNLTGTLDGTASFDPDGVVVGFHWTQIHGAPVVITGADTAIATFVSPPTPGILIFQLTVADEHGFTGTGFIAVDVFLNLVPIASAGTDRIVRPGSTVTANGSGSRDPDGTIASYAWTVASCFTITGSCTVALDGASTPTPSFVAPSSPGFVVLHLVVTDNAGAVASDDVTFGVFLQAPVAVIAAATTCARSGSTLTLDGSRSTDADGDIVSYAWTQLSGPPVVLTGANSAIATFTGPASGTLVFSLTVTDSDGLTASTTVTIAIDTPPVASATASATAVLAGTTVTLDGSHSVDATTFSWRQTAGSRVALSSPSAASPTFVAVNPVGAAFELVTFELTVTDACGATSTASVTIVVVASP
jgi:serine protease